MDHQQRKEIEVTAKCFMKSAYKHGVSVLLIDRFLRESNWDSTIPEIHAALRAAHIYRYDYNCSFDSLVWRRYLTNILEISGVSTYEQFEEVALQEAKDYYGIDQSTFSKYWSDFSQFTRELKHPLDPEWLIKGFHYFGFTFTRLLNKIRKENISITPNELQNIYNRAIGSYHFSFDELTLKPKPEASLDLKDFWILSYKIGKEVDTIAQWTEIFTGTDTTEDEINSTLAHPPEWAIFSHSRRV